jgi:hypothetical protein
MKARAFYTFEFQREVVDSLFLHLQNSKKDQVGSRKENSRERETKSSSIKFRRNSTGSNMRRSANSLYQKKTLACSGIIFVFFQFSNSCLQVHLLLFSNFALGSEGIDYVVSTHGFTRKSACYLLECCRKTGFIASKNPYEKYKDSAISHYFKVLIIIELLIIVMILR